MESSEAVLLLPACFYCVWLLSELLASAAQKKAAAGSVFVPEKGKFNILLDGKSVGHEDYEIAASSGVVGRLVALLP